MSDRPRDPAWLVFYCTRASESSHERTTLLRVTRTKPDPNDLPPEELLDLAKRHAGTGQSGSTGIPPEEEIPEACEALRFQSGVCALAIGTRDDRWYLLCGHDCLSNKLLEPTKWPATSGAFFSMLACWAASRDRTVASAGYTAVLAKSRFWRGALGNTAIKTFNKMFRRNGPPPKEHSWPFVIENQRSSIKTGGTRGQKNFKKPTSLVVISFALGHGDKVLVLPDEPAEIIGWLYPEGIPKPKGKQKSRSKTVLHLGSAQGRSKEGEHTCILASGVVERPTHLNPGTLLNARFSFAEFFPGLRQREWDCLEAWCRDPSPISIGVITGPGGSGKTRLLIEWTKHLLGLPDVAWCAGFLPDSLSEAEIDSLSSVERCTFVVVDYAESRIEQIDSLFHRLHSLRQRIATSSGSRIRIALLARGDGEWLTSLSERGTLLKAAIDSGVAIGLTPIKADRDFRARVFGKARDDFAVGLGTSPQQVSPALNGDVFARILNIHLAALAAAQYRPIPTLELVEDALDHELHYWLRSRGAMAVRPFLRRAARLVAALTLRGHTPLQDLSLLDARVGGPCDEGFRDLVSDIYLARGVMAASQRLVHGLEPDRLGEAVVLRVLRDVETPPDYLEQVICGADERTVEHALTVLGRLESSDADMATNWTTKVLERAPSSRAEAALRAVLSVANEPRPTRMGIILTDSLRGVEDPALAARIERAIPGNSVSLAHLSIWALSISLLEAVSPLDRARLLESIQSRLRSVGQFDKALAAASEAVEIYRQRMAESVETHSKDLASALSGYVGCLSAAGRHNDALVAAAEALEIGRSVFAMDPERESPHLIAKLINCSQVLGEVGQLEQSRALAEEAIALWRKSDLAGDPQSRLLLSSCLNNYGLTLRALGQFAEARTVYQEGLEIWRRAAEMRPDECMPHYAVYLNNQSLVYEALRQPASAIDSARESVEIFRELATVFPERYLALLANSLVTLASSHRAANRPRAALDSAEEADCIYRRLRECDPNGAYAEPLANCMKIIADALSRLGRSLDAIAEFRKCLDLCELLYSSSASGKKPYLANLRDVLSAYEVELARQRMRPYLDPVAVRVNALLEQQREKRASD